MGQLLRPSGLVLEEALPLYRISPTKNNTKMGWGNKTKYKGSKKHKGGIKLKGGGRGRPLATAAWPQNFDTLWTQSSDQVDSVLKNSEPWVAWK